MNRSLSSTLKKFKDFGKKVCENRKELVDLKKVHEFRKIQFMDLEKKFIYLKKTITNLEKERRKEQRKKKKKEKKEKWKV